MSLAITAASRISGSNCEHLSITFNIDGATPTGNISIPEIQNLFSSINDLLPAGNYKHLMLLLMARYYLDKGTYTLAQVITKCTVPD